MSQLKTKPKTKKTTPSIYIAIPGCGDARKHWTKATVARVAKAIKAQIREDRGVPVKGSCRRCVSYAPKRKPNRNVDIEVSYDQPLSAKVWHDARIELMLTELRKSLAPSAAKPQGKAATPVAMALTAPPSVFVCRSDYEYIPTAGGDLIVNYLEFQCQQPCDVADNVCQWVLVSSTVVHG